MQKVLFYSQRSGINPSTLSPDLLYDRAVEIYWEPAQAAAANVKEVPAVVIFDDLGALKYTFNNLDSERTIQDALTNPDAFQAAVTAALAAIAADPNPADAPRGADVPAE